MGSETMFVHAMVLFPEDDSHPVGLLLAEGDDGDHWSVVVDADWVITANASLEVGVDLTMLEVPESVRLPIAAAGWPDEWDVAGEAGVREVASRLRRARDWASLQQHFLDLLGDDPP